MSLNRWCCLFLTPLCLILTGTAAVWSAPGDSALIKSRQDKFRDRGGAFKAIDDGLKKRNPDWDNAITPNAQTVQSRSSYLLTWFPKVIVNIFSY
jgi:hypothetical protein